MDYRDIILLQAFNWESATKGGDFYGWLIDKIPLMRKFHVSHVWLPPPTKSVDRHGYLPTQYYDLNSSYGSFEDLKCLNRQLLASGLRPVADVVINHRSAECTDGDGRYNIYQDLVEHPGATMAWDQRAIASNDVKFGGKGGADTGEYLKPADTCTPALNLLSTHPCTHARTHVRTHAPTHQLTRWRFAFRVCSPGADYPHAADLDHENPMVVAGITDWLSWLRGVGFEGFRFDYGFGFSPQVTAKYVSATLDIQPTEDGSLFGDFAVIEGWNAMTYNGSSLDSNQDRHRQEIVDYVSGTGGTCAAFDFTLKGVLQEAVSKRQYWRLVDNRGRAPGVNAWWPSRACTFLDNHDTGSTQNHCAYWTRV